MRCHDCDTRYTEADPDTCHECDGITDRCQALTEPGGPACGAVIDRTGPYQDRTCCKRCDPWGYSARSYWPENPGGLRYFYGPDERWSDDS